MKTPLDTRGSRANDGRSARLGKKQPDGTHGHRIAHLPRPSDGWARAGGVPSGPARGRGAGARSPGADLRDAEARGAEARAGGSRRDLCGPETAWGPGSGCGNAYRFWYAMLHSLPSRMGAAELRASQAAIGSRWSRWLQLVGPIRGMGSIAGVGWAVRMGTGPVAIVRGG
jgi:hypothetical protein